MEIIVKILEIGKEEWIKNAKGGYGKVSVQYSGDKGEQSRNFVSYDTDIYQQVKKLKVGASYEVTIEKEGNFWNWKRIVEVSGVSEPSTGTTRKETPTGSNWDARLQFDREKQILIIRQSMVAAAVDTLGHGADPDTVLTLAEIYVNYVLHGPDADIPRAVEGDISEAPQQEEAPKRGPGRPRAVIA